MQFSQEDMIAFVSRTASAQFARGVALELENMLQEVLAHPQAPPQYKQGYQEAIRDVQETLNRFAELTEKKIEDSKNK